MTILLENGAQLLTEAGGSLSLEGTHAEPSPPSVAVASSAPAIRPMWKGSARPKVRLAAAGKWRPRRGR